MKLWSFVSKHGFKQKTAYVMIKSQMLEATRNAEQHCIQNKTFYFCYRKLYHETAVF